MKLALGIIHLVPIVAAPACDDQPAATGTYGPDTALPDMALADTAAPDTVDTAHPDSVDADAADTAPPEPAVCHPDQATLLTPEPVACDTNRGFCRDGVCLDDEDVCDYAWGDRLTILHTFEIGDQSDEVDPATGIPIDTCCFDLVGDGALDNALGRGFRNLKAVGLDLNAEFADQIERARMNYIFDFFGLDDPDDRINDPHVEFIGYETVHDEASDNPAIASGFGRFGMRHRSFLLPSRLPRVGAVGSIRDGRFVAPSGRFSYILSTVADGLAEIPIHNARFEFDVALGPNGRGLALSNGRMGGVVAVDEFFAALNAEVVEACACREFVGGYGPLNAATMSCRPATAAACDEDEALCMLLTNPFACDVFVKSFVADYDLDGDGTLDGLTAGNRFEGTSAEINGWYDACPR